jgi:16S rRNA (cytosine967-C5)-methyltransferase
MREATQLRIIEELIQNYAGKEPLSRYLKKYFNQNPQLGSRDRRVIQQFVHNYFRIGRMYAEKPVRERLAVANKLCKTGESPLLDYSFRDLTSIEKMASHLAPEKLFPHGRHLSDSINKAEFIHSFLIQPKVWIRVLREFSQSVEKELAAKEIPFEKDSDTPLAWSVKNSTPLDQLESYKQGHFEIQDLSSQRTIEYIQPQSGETWWDACAGAGGKALMMAAHEPTIRLFCTDARESILKNLAIRFQKAGFKNYSSKVLDLTEKVRLQGQGPFDGAVADVPCTGSGTWARTPEWLTFFDSRSLEKYQTIQRKIISTIAGFLTENKPFVYLTCSVFREENEDNTAWVTANLPLRLQRQAYLEGAAHGADTMFAARFVKT